MLTPKKHIEELTNQIARFTAITKTYLDGGEIELDDAIALAKFGYISIDDDAHTDVIRSFKNSPERGVIKRLSKEIDKYYALIENYDWDPDDFDLMLVLDRNICKEYEALCRDSIFKSDDANKKQIEDFRKTIDAIDNRTDGPCVWNGRSQMELDYETKWGSVFDSMEEMITRYQEFLKFRTLRGYTEHFTYYSIHDFLSSLEIAIEYVNDLVKVENPLDVMFGDSDEENSLLSLIKGAKSTDDIINRIWEHDFDSEDKADSKDETETDRPNLPTFFNLLQVDLIHKVCNNEQFEHISPGDMYSIINLQDCPRRLKVRSGEKNRVYFFIFFFGEMIDASHRAMWRKSMCHHLCMSYSTYNSKYTELRSRPSKKDEKFLEKLDDLKEQFEDLREAS